MSLLTSNKEASEFYLLCCFAVCFVVLQLSPYRLLDGAVIFADVVDNARDTEGTGEAQQVGQEAECDAEDKRPAECFPQGLPDQLRAQGCGALWSLSADTKKSGKISACRVKYMEE